MALHERHGQQVRRWRWQWLQRYVAGLSESVAEALGDRPQGVNSGVSRCRLRLSEQSCGDGEAWHLRCLGKAQFFQIAQKALYLPQHEADIAGSLRQPLWRVAQMPAAATVRLRQRAHQPELLQLSQKAVDGADAGAGMVLARGLKQSHSVDSLVDPQHRHQDGAPRRGHQQAQ